MAQWPRTRLPMQETWVRSLGREDPLEEGIATYSSILVWEIPWTEEIWWATFHGVTKESDRRGLATKQQQQINLIMQKWLSKLFSISFNNLPFTSNVCHISREGLGSKVPFFLIFTKLCTPSSLPFHSSVFWRTTWKVTQTSSSQMVMILIQHISFLSHSSFAPASVQPFLSSCSAIGIRQNQMLGPEPTGKAALKGLTPFSHRVKRFADPVWDGLDQIQFSCSQQESRKENRI